eukprot:2328116-Rhodomonas_salina.1
MAVSIHSQASSALLLLQLLVLRPSESTRCPSPSFQRHGPFSLSRCDVGTGMGRMATPHLFYPEGLAAEPLRYHVTHRCRLSRHLRDERLLLRLERTHVRVEGLHQRVEASVGAEGAAGGHSAAA